MRVAIIVWAMFAGFACSGQSTKFPLQEVIDSVYLSESGEESFALYLPAAYQPDGYSSVVLIFDPMGRGNIGISPFINAAEMYNHVLICSNQSKNGPYERNFQITSMKILI